MRFVKTLRLDAPFEQVCDQVLEAFRAQGFGVLTTVDVQEVMRQKLQKEVSPYRIYGICNPQLADRALAISPEVGVMLPCSVVVRAEGSHSQVHVLSPTVIGDLSSEPDLGEVMDEADRRVQAATEQLAPSR
ncbi:MAG: DUF302 domain-containing protein [Candidatus Dormibacteria bacterium]